MVLLPQTKKAIQDWVADPLNQGRFCEGAARVVLLKLIIAEGKTAKQVPSEGSHRFQPRLTLAGFQADSALANYLNTIRGIVAPQYTNKVTLPSPVHSARAQ